MIDSVTGITLDLQETNTMVSVSAKRGDTGRRLLISLSDGGVPYTVGEDCYAVFTGKKPDGTVLYDRCSVENNVICYAFTEQTCAVAGRIRAEIRVYGNGGKLITGAGFNLEVHDTVVHEDDVVSSDEMNALDTLVTETVALKNEIQRKLDNGEFVGQPGPPGADGAVAFDALTEEQRRRLEGKSAYDFAKDGGYTGSEADFAKKLVTEYLPLGGGRMTGSIDMNGKTLGGLKEPAAGDHAATKSYVDITRSVEQGGTGATEAEAGLFNLGGCKIGVIWENASPSSAFDAQRITVEDVASYSLFIFECANSTTASARTFTFARKGFKTACIIMANLNSENVKLLFTSRAVLVSNNGYIDFESGYSRFSDEAASERTDRAIPIRVYGIKGVIAQ